MRGTMLAFVIVSCALAALLALAYGCTGGGSCEDRETCPPAGDDGATPAEASLAEDGSASEAEAAPACDPDASPKDSPCVLDEAYGVFVAAPDPSEAGGPDAGNPASAADGTRTRPYTTLGDALANLAGKHRVYVCNGVYPEQVTLSTAVSLYSGLSCEAQDASRTWMYVGGAAQVVSPSSAFALSVTAANTDAGVSDGAVEAGDASSVAPAVTIEDMAFATPSASPPGASSVAALFSNATVSLTRVTLRAGAGSDGAPGADGALTPNYRGAAPPGGAQVLDTGGGVISPGAGSSQSCLQFGTSAGGDGGIGCSLDAGFGTAGTSDPVAPVTTDGRDGLPREAPLPDGGMSTANDPGADGVPGDAGTAADTYGSLTAVGWTPSGGSGGAPGGPGQGGAGAADPLANSNCNAPLASIGGGGGGAGGCGGAGGQGGEGGGASVALASFQSRVELQACVLSAESGGTGGAGGAGQDGQGGAAGGDNPSSTEQHTAGAPGGNGAGGAGGAGGTGGLSVGILVQGGQVLYDSATSIAVAAAGAGGTPGPGGRPPSGAPLATGSAGPSGAAGRPGVATTVLALP